MSTSWDLRPVAESFGAAAFDPTQWIGAMDGLTQTVGATGASLIPFNVNDSRLGVVVMAGVSEVFDRWTKEGLVQTRFARTRHPQAASAGARDPSINVSRMFCSLISKDHASHQRPKLVVPLDPHRQRTGIRAGHLNRAFGARPRQIPSMSPRWRAAQLLDLLPTGHELPPSTPLDGGQSIMTKDAGEGRCAYRRTSQRLDDLVSDHLPPPALGQVSCPHLLCTSEPTRPRQARGPRVTRRGPMSNLRQSDSRADPAL